MNEFNYDCFLGWLEQANLLTGAWSGSTFDELPEEQQKRIELCVARLRVEFNCEKRDASR